MKNFIIIAVLIALKAPAQPPAQTYTIEQTLNTTTVIQSKIPIETFSFLTVTQEIRLQKAPDGFAADIRTLHMRDSVYANGETAVYTSQQPPQSLGSRALAAQMSAVLKVSTNAHGVVQSATAETSDNITMMLGLIFNSPVAGSVFLYPQVSSRKKWKENINVEGVLTKGEYEVSGRGDRLSVRYTTSTEANEWATTTNGLAIVDKTTGIILSREEKSVTSAYKEINGHLLPVQIWKEKIEKTKGIEIAKPVNDTL